MPALQTTNSSLFSFREAWHCLFKNRISACVLLLVLIINLHFLFKHSRLSTSPLSRYKTVECLLEHGTFEITRSAFPVSIDAINVDGKFYSDKPPLYSVVMAAEAAPLYYLFDMKLSEKTLFYEKYFLLINQVIPFLFILLLACHLMSLLGFTDRFMALGIVVLSLGNLTMAYTIAIINHAPTAVFCFIAFYIVALSEIRQQEISGRAWFKLGALLGLAVSYEIYALSLLAGIWVYNLARYRKATPVLILSAGTALPIMISAALNVLITGSPLPFYFVKSFFHYEGSYWLKPEGFDALNDGYLMYLFNITFGHHGLFIITPLLFFVFVLVKNAVLKPLYLVCKLAAVFTLLLMIVFTNNYGGYAIGFRFCIFLFPVMLFYCVHAAHQHRANKLVTAAFLLCLCISAFSVWEGLSKDPLTRGTIDKFLLELN